jgi:large subunit ribosomal protein L1
MSLKLTKRQKQFKEVLDQLNQPTSFDDAIVALRKALEGVSKYDEAVECHVRLGINMKHADQQIRTTVVLPEGTGKVVRVAVIAKGEKVAEARAAGADIAGSEELIERMQKENFLDFDVLIATPDMMAQVGKLGRVLGPKGLMPNPKTGTVTADVATAVKNVKAGQIEVRPDKQGIVHIGFGKKSFTDERLRKNLHALYDTIMRAKPSAAKGTYVKSLYLSTTQGPSIKLDPAKLSADIRDAVGSV